MDLRLKRERVEYLSCLINRSTEDAFTTDAVIRDALPDAEEVVFTNGDFCLWRLDLSNGSAEAEGEWKGTVCYRAEETGKLCSFPVSVGVRMRIHDDKIVPELKPFASFLVTELSGQIMNSRKVRVRIRVKMALRAYQTDEMEYVTGVENEAEDMFFRTDQMVCSVVTSLEEQVFTAADRLALRSIPADTILSSGSQVIADAPQRSGARAVLRGRVVTHLLYVPEDQSVPIVETVETPFSQLLDLQDAPGSETLLTGLQLTSSAIHLMEDGALETEFHIVAQTLCVHELQIAALTDAYSVSDMLEIERETMTAEHWTAHENLNEAAEISIGASEVSGTVITASSQLRSFQKCEQGYSGTAVVAAFVKKTDDRFAEFRIEVPVVLDTSTNCEVYGLEIGTPAFALSGDQLQIRVPVAVQTVETERSHTVCIQSILKTGSDPKFDQMPSLTLVQLNEAADLWQIAKKYGSSVAAIQSANPQLQDGVRNEFCLIPRIIVG